MKSLFHRKYFSMGKNLWLSITKNRQYSPDYTVVPQSLMESKEYIKNLCTVFKYRVKLHQNRVDSTS